MRVVSNTAVSLDGRIATAAYEHVALGTPTDRDYMSVLRARSDAVLVGGRTFRNWPLPLVPDAAALDRLRAQGFPDVDHPPIAGRRWWNVILTRTLDLPASVRFWRDERVRPLVVTPTEGEVPGERVAGTTPQDAVAALEARGVGTLLLECGGDLLFQFLAADLVDELHVTLCPLVLGGRGAPSLVDGLGFAAASAPRWRLVSSHPVGDELYLRYARRTSSGAEPSPAIGVA